MFLPADVYVARGRKYIVFVLLPLKHLDQAYL